MYRATRSMIFLAALTAAVFALASADRAFSGPAKPAPENKRLIAISDADVNAKKVLVMTTTRNIASLVLTGPVKIIKGGSRASFVDIKEGLALDCRGIWDTSTSPMSFRATQVKIGGRVMKKQPITRSRWKVSADKSPGRTFSARPVSAAHAAKKETSAAPQLELSGWKWEHGAAGSVVRGRIKNLTKSTFPNVVGVVRYYTSEGRLVVSDSLVVGGNELAPGESCGFELRTTWAPGYSPTVAKADIEFHCASGKLVVRDLSLSPGHTLGKS